MSSSQPANPRRAWSLRLRLLAGQIVVLAVVCVGISAATELALLHHLVRQLDGQLAGTSYRSALLYPEPKRPGWRQSHSYYPSPGPGPRFLDAPGQPAGMVAAVISNGKIGRRRLPDQHRYPCRREPNRPGSAGGDRRQPQTGNPGPRRPRALSRRRRPEPERGRHHRYRPVDVHRRRHDVADADHLGIVTLIALTAATIAGAVIIRRALAPLAARRANREQGRGPAVGARRSRTAGAGARIRRQPLHRGGPARIGTEPDARPHRGRTVGAAGQRDPRSSVRRRRESRAAHAACRDPRLHRTHPTHGR